MWFIVKIWSFRIGWKLKELHRVLEFNQSKWLKLYIEFNIKKKQKQEKVMTNMGKHCTN